MGRIGRVLKFTRVSYLSAKVTEVLTGLGGGHEVTNEHFAPAGDDSHPLSTDHNFIVENQRSGGFSSVGYLDPLNAGVAGAGEKRIYGRDSTGAPVNEVWCKANGDVLVSNSNGSVTLGNDGSVTGTNGSGQFSLQAGGDFVVNGVTIDVAGNITTTAAVNSGTMVATTSMAAPSIISGGKDMTNHTHPAGTPPGNTGVNN